MQEYGFGREGNIGQVVEKLGDLLKLDVDAVQAYNEAIEKMESAEYRARLSSFRDDHERHVTELTQAIRSLSEEPPQARPDVKGVLIEGMTKLRSALGDEQALKAMHQNEELTNRAYEDASRETYWPSDTRTIIERGLSDERRHIQWIEQQLAVTAGSAGRGTTGGGGGTYL